MTPSTGNLLYNRALSDKIKQSSSTHMSLPESLYFYATIEDTLAHADHMDLDSEEQDILFEELVVMFDKQGVNYEC